MTREKDYIENALREKRGENNEKFRITGVILGLILLVIGAIWGIVFLSDLYTVWSSGQAGKAELSMADYNRQVLVRTAQAQNQAAAFQAKTDIVRAHGGATADVIRAGGVAKANKIIGQSLENNKDYLTWKFIDELPQNKNQIIYLPSNGKLPFTEAGRAVK